MKYCKDCVFNIDHKCDAFTGIPLEPGWDEVPVDCEFFKAKEE